MAAGGLGGDPVTWAKGDALQGSPVTARAAFVSAFLGNSWSRAREDGMEEGTRRDRGAGGADLLLPWQRGGEMGSFVQHTVTGVPGRADGDFGVPRAGTVTMATVAASQAVAVTLPG